MREIEASLPLSSGLLLLFYFVIAKDKHSKILLKTENLKKKEKPLLYKVPQADRKWRREGFTYPWLFPWGWAAFRESRSCLGCWKSWPGEGSTSLSWSWGMDGCCLLELCTPTWPAFQSPSFYKACAWGWAIRRLPERRHSGDPMGWTGLEVLIKLSSCLIYIHL